LSLVKDFAHTGQMDKAERAEGVAISAACTSGMLRKKEET